MNPIQFALQDRATKEFFHAYANSEGIAAWGWGLMVFLLLIVLLCFWSLYKGDKKADAKAHIKN